MGKLIVISGPSGVGKGTIVKKLLKTGGYALSVSCTTRARATAKNATSAGTAETANADRSATGTDRAATATERTSAHRLQKT